MSLIAILAATLAATFQPTLVNGQGTDWRYCQLATRPYGDPVYFSEAFPVAEGTDAVGLQNSFNSFVTARYDPHALTGAICFGPYETATQAADALNDQIGDQRRAGKSVVLTRWRSR